MLQQTRASFPFMQQLISLAQVARRTSQDNIAHIVRSSTRKRDNVIDMIGIFAFMKFYLAVIAMPFLSLVLFSNLLSSINALRLLLASNTVKHMYLLGPASFLRLPISPLTLSVVFSNSISLGIGLFLFLVLLTVTLAIRLLTFRPCLAVGLSFFLATLFFSISQRSLIRTILTNWAQSVGIAPIKREVIQRCRKNAFAISALPITVSGNNICWPTILSGLSVCFAAYLALFTQAIRRLIQCGSIKKIFGGELDLHATSAPFITNWHRWESRLGDFCTRFTGCSVAISLAFIALKRCERKKLLASPASLLCQSGGIVHDRNCLSFLALFLCCQGSKATPFLHRFMTPVLGNIFIIPLFFRSARKTEMVVSG